MSRKGFLSLRTSSPEYSTRFSGNHRSCGDIDREIDSSHELTFPRSIQGSTHHGRALLFSYEEFQSKQSQTSSLSSSYLPVYEPNLNSIQKGAQNFVDDDENLVDTPPDSPKGTEKWGCSACTFLNELSARSCQLCDTPKNGITETVLFDNKEKIEVCNDDTTVSESEWEVQDDSTVDIQSDGSADERENEDDEAEADSNIELMFQQCLPPLKSRSHQKSTEIVDLTGLESGIKKRLSASSDAVEEIEDFEDDDFDNIPSSHPFLQHFRTVKDLRKGGYNVIDFSKFTLSCATSRAKSSSYDTRREKRNEKTITKKRRPSGPPTYKGGGRGYKKRSKQDKK